MPAPPRAQPRAPVAEAAKRAAPPPALRIEDVRPRVDCGDEPVKRCLGDIVEVTATVLAHGHKTVRATVRYRRTGDLDWTSTPMTAVPDVPDRFRGGFAVDALGLWEFAIHASTDPWATWQDELRRKVAAGQRDLASELAEGSQLAGEALATSDAALAFTADTVADETTSPRTYTVQVDPVLARFGSWYELFPRSFGGLAGVEAVIPELAALRFDVLYLTPIHPIGTTNRKGRNNRTTGKPGEPGSPWAIGSAAGGHTAIEPALGTIDDFDRLVATARAAGIEIALDLAFQASPDHPWLAEHPEWFRRRPDGTVKFAENPPKRYEDIVNFDFDGDDWQPLWAALANVIDFWVEHGVRVFRVDNPHTKPLAFWSCVLGELRRTRPDVIFLSEAFTRPPMMQALAKIGFHQSYSYFTWRNTAAELATYITELAGDMHEYFRPNFFTNTPDILTEYLQQGGPAAFHARLVLAATLAPAYGIYSGFEHFERVAREPGSEEYRDSEKYELRSRALDGPLLPLVGRLNAIRRRHRAFQRLDNIAILESAHDSLLVYCKRDGNDVVICCVNVDPHAHAEGLAVVTPELGLPDGFTVRDLLSGEQYSWHTGANYVLLPPGDAHLMSVQGLPS